MARPLIGVVALWRSRKTFYGMYPGYMEWVERAGGIPVMLPYLKSDEAWEAAVHGLDGILFTGGPDLHPKYYGEEPMDVCGEDQPERDEAEYKLFEIGVKKHGKPALGICKGCQIINAMMGGTLYQDLHTQVSDRSVNHSQPQKGSKTSHSAALVPGTPLHRVLGQETVMVNSFHHQAVKELAPGLKVMATAPNGVVEAFCGETGFLWGIQWHPEMLPADWEDSHKIFTAFVEACGK